MALEGVGREVKDCFLNFWVFVNHRHGEEHSDVAVHGKGLLQGFALRNDDYNTCPVLTMF